MDCPNTLKYNPTMILTPGTLMTVFKCPVDGCGKNSCTDLKSFKLHCLHIHRDRDLAPIITQDEAKYICQVENCGKLYMEKKQYEIHQRHHKTYGTNKLYLMILILKIQHISLLKPHIFDTCTSRKKLFSKLDLSRSIKNNKVILLLLILHFLY